MIARPLTNTASRIPPRAAVTGRDAGIIRVAVPFGDRQFI